MWLIVTAFINALRDFKAAFKAELAELRRQRDWPVGARVRLTGACCWQNTENVGQTGTIKKIDDMDFHVVLDSDPSNHVYICPKGMTRI